jgi:hypothetical protein
MKLDNAGAGRCGLPAMFSPELLEAVGDYYGFVSGNSAVDLGGSSFCLPSVFYRATSKSGARRSATLAVYFFGASSSGFAA